MGKQGCWRDSPGGFSRSRPLAAEVGEWALDTLWVDHLCFFTSNHSRPIAAAITMPTMLHSVDEVGCSLIVVVACRVEGSFIGVGSLIADAEFVFFLKS